MIVLDTNIISEMMKPSPSVKVISWMNDQETSSLFLTSITIAEITYGLAALPQGNRRKILEKAFQESITQAFNGRILDFNFPSAKQYGRLMARRKKFGKPMSILDAQIASITHTHQFKLATRNTPDFTDCELTLINPFL